MRNIFSDTTQDDNVLEQAAEYYLALQDNSMSGAELKAWQAWFLRSKRHQAAFRKLEVMWGVLEQLSVDDFAHLQDAKPETTSATKYSDGSVLSLMTQNVKEKPTKTISVQWIQAIAASIAVVAIAGYLTIIGGEPSAVNPVTIYATVADEQRAVTLADGSIMELGPLSQVDVNYTADVRQLTLVSGQAIFTVAKNPNRPFVVRAGRGSVTALGTVFNVQKINSNVQVRVLEGTVAVRPVYSEPLATIEKPISVALVTAGLQTSYTEDGDLLPLQAVDVWAGLDWRVGVLTMVNKKMSDVIQELNRFVENEITIGDEAIGHFNFTGTVYPDQVDDWLVGIQLGYPVKVVRVGSSTVLMLDEAKLQPQSTS